MTDKELDQVEYYINLGKFSMNNEVYAKLISSLTEESARTIGNIGLKVQGLLEKVMYDYLKDIMDEHLTTVTDAETDTDTNVDPSILPDIITELITNSNDAPSVDTLAKMFPYANAHMNKDPHLTRFWLRYKSPIYNTSSIDSEIMAIKRAIMINILHKYLTEDGSIKIIKS